MSFSDPLIPTVTEVNAAIKKNLQPKQVVVHTAQSEEQRRYEEYVAILRKQLNTIVQWPLHFEVNDYYGGVYSKNAHAKFKHEVSKNFTVRETVQEQIDRGETYNVYHLLLSPLTDQAASSNA